MKSYHLKVFYLDELAINYESDLNSVLDYISVLLDAVARLESVVNPKAFTFSITEVLN